MKKTALTIVWLAAVLHTAGDTVSAYVIGANNWHLQSSLQTEATAHVISVVKG